MTEELIKGFMLQHYDDDKTEYCDVLYSEDKDELKFEMEELCKRGFLEDDFRIVAIKD